MAQDLSALFDNAKNLDEKRENAQLFLEDKFEDSKDKLANIEDILVKLCVELDDVNNPFVTLTGDLFQKNLSPTRKYMIALNNLYATNVIDDQDLEYHGSDGVDTIIANPQLASSEVSSDIEFIVKSYYWLSQNSNLKRLNYNGLKDLASLKGYDNLIDACNSEDKGLNIRNAIVFSDGANPKDATIRSRKEIEELLHAAARRDSTTSAQASKSDELKQEIRDMSAEERADFYNSLRDDNLL